MKREDLLGTWTLYACQGESSDGRKFLPYGEQPLGTLVYLPDGLMSVHLMARDRSLFASEDISQATADEIRSAFASFDAYSGRWEFDQSESIVVHDIECGKVPNWVGKKHKRFCELHDQVLTLRTEVFPMAGSTWSVSVHWKRMIIGPK